MTRQATSWTSSIRDLVSPLSSPEGVQEKPGRFEWVHDKIDREERDVYPTFETERLTNVASLTGGTVIMDSSKRELTTADEVVQVLF